MVEQIICEDCPPSVAAAVRAYWDGKRVRLERLLGRTPPDQRRLRLSVRRSRERYEGRGVLTMPTGTLVASGDGDDPRGAVEQVIDRLAREVVRHRELLRHDALARRRRRRELEFAVAGAPLADDTRRRDEVAFRTLLRPLLRDLRDHARHELVIAQLEGRLAQGSVTVSDLVDEVTLRAWERFADRPADRPFDSWLVELLHEVVDEYAPAAESLDPSEPLSTDDPRFESDLGWIVENEPFWGEAEPLRIEDVLPEAELPEVLRLLDAEEQYRWVAAQLRGLPSAERRAFILTVLEGWSDVEVAMLLGRSPDAVRDDVERVRQRLRERWRQEVGDAASSGAAG